MSRPSGLDTSVAASEDEDKNASVEPVSPLPPAGAKGHRSQRSGHARKNSLFTYVESVRKLHFQEQEHQFMRRREGVDKTKKVIFLPRGGTYVNAACGPIQFGLPPETIKDCMAHGLPLPSFYVLPKERFNLQMGLNVAEIEFPAYFNFFIKRVRVNLIVHKDVEPIIRLVFKTCLLGPDEIKEPARYSKAIPKEAYPDLRKEALHFQVNPFDKSPLTIDTLLNFVHFDEKGVATLPNGVQIVDAGEEFAVLEPVPVEAPPAAAATAATSTPAAAAAAAPASSAQNAAPAAAAAVSPSSSSSSAAAAAAAAAGGGGEVKLQETARVPGRVVITPVE